jgi:hypothetical protein
LSTTCGKRAHAHFWRGGPTDQAPDPPTKPERVGGMPFGRAMGTRLRGFGLKVGKTTRINFAGRIEELVPASTRPRWHWRANSPWSCSACSRTMCRSIRLPRPQRPKTRRTNRFSGGPSHQVIPKRRSPCRDEGPGQAVTRVVDASNDVITLSADWPTCSSHEPHQATALRRSRTEASARQADRATARNPG